jgi:hypothetical protein
MKRLSLFIALFIAAIFVPLSLEAEGAASPIGLGILLGVSFPQGSTSAIPSVDWQPSFNWGFYVNIPIISTLNLMTSSELYRFGNENATDFDLAIKLIVPLSDFSLYAGFAPGFTAVREALDIHIGLLGGGTMKLVSNLDIFAQVKYVFLFDGNENIRILHLNAGLLFNF